MGIKKRPDEHLAFSIYHRNESASIFILGKAQSFEWSFGFGFCIKVSV